MLLIGSALLMVNDVTRLPLAPGKLTATLKRYDILQNFG
jgi:hypothetical protein